MDGSPPKPAERHARRGSTAVISAAGAAAAGGAEGGAEGATGGGDYARAIAASTALKVRDPTRVAT